MFNHEDELSHLREKIRRREALKVTQSTLEQERKVLQTQLQRLKTTAEAEQQDVDRLEDFTLQNLIYRMTGQKLELLEKERREADVAWLEHDATAARLVEVEAQLARCTGERADLYDSEVSYWAMLEQQLASASDPGPVAEEMICRLEQIRSELSETIGQGFAAKEMGLNVLESLRSIDISNEQLTGTSRVGTLDNQLWGTKLKMDRFREGLAEFDAALKDHALTAPLSPGDLLRLEPLKPEDLRSHSALAERIRLSESAVKAARRKITDILDQLEAIFVKKMQYQTELQRYIG